MRRAGGECRVGRSEALPTGMVGTLVPTLQLGIQLLDTILNVNWYLASGIGNRNSDSRERLLISEARHLIPDIQVSRLEAAPWLRYSFFLM
jgi:hypothetical protein